MKKNLLSMLAIFVYVGLSASTIFAGNVDIDTSLPSGTYDKAIRVELMPTDPTAKIFYSFDPKGTPNDLIKYEGPILIKASTPLIYWTFLTTDNESKIKQNDYILQFTNDIKLGAGAAFEDGTLKNVSLINNSSALVDISYWEARNDGGAIIIPEGTLLNAGQSYSVGGLTGSGIISLFSPDEEKKDFIEVQVINKEVALIQEKPTAIKKSPYVPRKVAKIPKKTTVAIVEKPVQAPTEIKTPDTTAVPPIQSPSVENAATPTALTPTEAKPEIQTPANNDFNNSIKASTQESTKTSDSTGKFVIIGVLAAAVLGGVGMKFAKKS